jgi:aconitate hydratase
VQNDIVAAAVLSGNRNFEARIHPNIRANFLASPPLVVAYAIAGNVTRPDDRAGRQGQGRRDIYLGDIWPTRRNPRAAEVRDGREDVQGQLRAGQEAEQAVGKIKGTKGQVYDWPKSTYIAEPPFFEDFAMSRAAIRPSGRARAGRVRRLGHDRPHLPGRLDQGTRRPASGCWRTACSRPTSTATARAAATTR